jgi:hypothetical protein
MKKRTVVKYRYLIRVPIVITMGLLFGKDAVSQNNGLQLPFGNGAIPNRPNIILPASRGATVWSTYLHGIAANRIAAGSYLESAARANLSNGHARLAHIEANRAAIRYHTERVSAFIDLRKMNKAYRRELNPLIHERVAEADKKKDELIREQPEYVLAQLDITGQLNWMFVRLTNRLFTDELLNDTEIFGGNNFKQELTRFQLQHIYLESITRIDGNRIRTPLVNTNAGQHKLPPVFLMPGLEKSSGNYVAARQLILNAIKDEDPNTPSYEQWQLIHNSLEQLRQSLSREIPASQRSIPSAFHDYYSGKRFIESQSAAMMYVLRTDRVEQLIGKDVFDGETIGELLNFMVQHGLQFSRPETGGRSSYETLFRMMRIAYMVK